MRPGDLLVGGNPQLLSFGALGALALNVKGESLYQAVMAGRMSLEVPETIRLVKTHTRRLAKRQCTWFRSLSECRFVAVPGRIDAVECARRIVQLGGLGMVPSRPDGARLK